MGPGGLTFEGLNQQSAVARQLVPPIFAVNFRSRATPIELPAASCRLELSFPDAGKEPSVAGDMFPVERALTCELTLPPRRLQVGVKAPIYRTVVHQERGSESSTVTQHVCDVMRRARKLGWLDVRSRASRRRISDPCGSGGLLELGLG